MPEPSTSTRVPGTLVFVYKADSGLFNTVADIAHKIFSPDTYACSLCALTHGTFTMRAQCKRFIESLDVPCHMLHEDQFRDAYGTVDAALPAVFVWRETGLELCLDAATIAGFEDFDALAAAVLARCIKD